jgi:tetratricopeptide (TPR) repeat protein
MKLLKTIGLSILVLLFLSVDLCFGQIVTTTEYWEFFDKGVEYGSLGKLDEAREEFKKAKEWYEKAMRNPDGHTFSQVINNLRIIEYLDQQKIELYLAVHYFKTVNKLKKENWDQFDRTISPYDNAVKKTDQAISYFNEVVKLKPGDPFVNFIRAYIYENNSFPYKQQGNGWNEEPEYDKAIADYSKAIELNPEFIDAYLRRGNIYSRKGQYNNAISDYSRLIELKPEDPESYYIRGGTYIGKGEYDNAISDFSKAIELKPGHVAAYAMRGLLYYNKGQYHNPKTCNRVTDKLTRY